MIEKIPAQVVLVFNRDKTVKGVSLSQHTFVDGEFIKTSDASHVEGFSDTVIQESLPGFNAITVLERDAAWEEVNALKEELATAWIACDSANAQIRELGEKFKDYDLLKTNYDLATDENTRLKKQLESIQANRS